MMTAPTNPPLCRICRRFAPRVEVAKGTALCRAARWKASGGAISQDGLTEDIAEMGGNGLTDCILRCWLALIRFAFLAVSLLVAAVVNVVVFARLAFLLCLQRLGGRLRSASLIDARFMVANFATIL
jgi:hypothetical protein